MSGAGGKQNKLNAAVYSFFNGELAPMDVVDLLNSSNSWIDPNLIALLPAGGVESCDDAKRKRRKRNKEDKHQQNISVDAKTEE